MESEQMKELYKKQILDTFSEQLQIRFEHFCSQQGLVPTNQSLITYLIDRGLISPTSLQNYTVVHTYLELSNKNELTKTQIVEILAHRFNLSSRSIWKILSKHNPKNEN